jgi:hypothetical protein
LLVPGECYLVVDLETERGHLYIVASWPDANGKALFINVTDERHDIDSTCSVNVGDHTFIKYPSNANYYDAIAMTESRVEQWKRENRMFVKPRANRGFLRRVQDGARATGNMKPRYLYFRQLMDGNPPPDARLREITPKIVVKRKQATASNPAVKTHDFPVG